jgi:polyisoprenoid-binding protein YceI
MSTSEASTLPQNSTPTIMPTSGLWRLDSNHSTVTFSIVHHQVATFRSSFVKLEGEYVGATQQFTGEVAVENMTIPRPELRKHLMSDEFFDAEQFPTFTFASTKIVKDGENLAVEGEITLRGVTKTVTGIGIYHPQRTVRSGIGFTNERFGMDLATSIDRRDFGISFNNFIAEGVVNLGWIVKLDAALEFIEQTDD